MNLSNIQPKTKRKAKKRVGRGGKKGTFSGKGTKGQKSRAGAYVRPGFRGGDNRIWQLFPKQRGASKKPGNSSPHKKHRFFQLRKGKFAVLNVEFFNRFNDNDTINPEMLAGGGFDIGGSKKIKILGTGKLSKKLKFEGFIYSETAKTKIESAGGSILK